MRLASPSIPSRYAATAGAILATTMLLAGCDSENVDDATSVDEDSWSDWFSFGDDEGEEGGDSEQADGEGNEEEEDSWSIGDWFSFGDDEEDGGESEQADGEEEDSGGEDEESGEQGGDQAAMPDSCAGVGAEQLASGLAPQGATVVEDSGGIDGAPDAEQLSCVWSESGGSGQSFALVFTENADPSARLDVAQQPDGEEMNWEVDIDVNVDNYRTAQADSLGGELDYVATVEGSTKSLHLSMPDDFYVSAIAVSSDAGKKDLEDVVFQAAEQAKE
ncbi:hypothetical protein F4561_005358 [Lipingzhangella halophila]|uniref:DUF3558 domain-containing protein n=1 Tax=Lipingzhangella halophila TaxID=1783352 RepID=A0A7W7RMX4_9ACTN|nr:hypothetical protein [Lipingzhangella halophila]MBB4934538.1 hypothetical protein [Lipingzhangella halophila]